MRRAIVTLLALVVLVAEVRAADDIVVTELLVLPAVGRAGRSPIRIDPIEARIVAGDFKAPSVGDTMKRIDGERVTWSKATVNDKGWFVDSALRGGWAYVAVTRDAPGTFLLHAAGHSIVRVNGEPRMGDPYGFGMHALPVRLKKGVNHLLFHVGRGRLRVRLESVEDGHVAIDPRDATLPDVRVGDDSDLRAGLVVVNASQEAIRVEGVRTVSIPPLSLRKVELKVSPATREVGPTALRFEATKVGGGEIPSVGPLKTHVRDATSAYRVTFRSSIDGSLQYYAVRPADLREDDPPPAIVFTLHGASVEGINQARAYSSKRGAWIVAPTNRRPFGFDWEDWGRADALEVMELAKAAFPHDPSRVYLTGHSMGGHGTWHLGATFPDKFAAIGPSAGWSDFWSYVGAPESKDDDPIGAILKRATLPSRTRELAVNFLQHGVYVLHGDADDNVPVREARLMRKTLADLGHRDVSWHEQPGAGHWWNVDDEPGADCVDWAPMFDFFERRRIPRSEAVRDVRFVTANPGISARSHWVTIEQPMSAFRPASVDLRFDPHRRRFKGTTTNVRKLTIDLEVLPGKGPVRYELDGGGEFEVAGAGIPNVLSLEREDGAGGEWSVGPWEPDHKGPHRFGPFKAAFDRHFMFVVGTAGTAEETAWAWAKARFDAETWLYRGNGSVDIVTDRQLLGGSDVDRSVILYGNAETNAAWPKLLRDCPVRVDRTGVTVGKRRVEGANLACLFVWPRWSSDLALVGVVAGTGAVGARLTERLPYFVSGVAFPDLTVIGAEMLERGLGGVRVAGFFGNDWSIDRGEIVFRE